MTDGVEPLRAQSELAGADAPRPQAGVRFGRWEGFALLAIVALAVGLRFVGLGSLSFAGDEETTTLAALALLDGWPPTLPGGLVYTRGLPFTGLESLAILLFGVNEFALRFFPALLAGPRIAALWWFARPFLGPRLALVAAAGLGLACLDIEQSRTARMYSLFATLDLLAIAAAIHTALGARCARTAFACGVGAMATHVLAATHAVVPAVAALGRGLSLGRRVSLFALTGGLGLAFLGFRQLSRWSYSGAGVKGAPASSSPVAEHLAAMGTLVSEPMGAVWVALGGAGVLVLCALSLPRLVGALPRLAALVTAGAFAAASPVFGAPLLLGTLILAGIPPREAFSRAGGLLAAGVVGCAGWVMAALAVHGVGRPGIEAAARLLLGFPAPNWFELSLAGPVLVGLALMGCVIAADRASRAPLPGIWLALVVAGFGPVLLSGVMERSEALRYQIHSLGPLLVLAVLAAHEMARRVARAPQAALVLTALLAFAAVRADDGLRLLGQEHGPVEASFVDRSVAPDHHGAADFVREHATASDWIAAEDPLQQHLLIGRTDVWLRRFEDAAGFLRADPEGGLPRDIYTGTRHVGDIAALRALARAEKRRVVWLITSGEVEPTPSFFRTAETDALLREWRPLAWFRGADGLTRVYRLVDGQPVRPDRLASAAQTH